MTLVLAREKLLSVLDKCVPATDSRNNKLELGSVYLCADNGLLIGIGTNLEMEVSTSIEIGDKDSKVEFLLPAQKAVSIVKALEADAVLFIDFLEGDRLLVRAGKSKFILRSLPVGGFEKADVADKVVGKLDMTGATLHRMLSKVVACQGTNDVRQQFNGTHIEFKDGRLTLVATDGHRLATTAGDVSGEGFVSAIVPRAIVDRLVKLANEAGDEDVTLSFTPSRVILKTPKAQLIGKLLEMSYANWRRVIPQQRAPNRWRVLASDLKSAVSSVMIVANEKFSPVVCSLSEDGITLAAKSGSKDDATIAGDGEYVGAPLEVGLNGGYLIDALSPVSGMASLHFSDSASGILIIDEADDASLYVVMPIRL